jgi:hypothetical protein
LAEDLPWVQNALKKYSARITARDHTAPMPDANESTSTSAQALVLDTKGFLGS